jgi:very-short-patch-repair endonuclease
MREEEAKSRMHAKTMRKQMTKAELLLWIRLREANGHGFKFRRQHPIGPYIADFAHLRARLIIEIDGATHWTVDERAQDRRREDYLRGRGRNVIRFTNQAIYENVEGVVEVLLHRLRPHPTDVAHRSTSPASGRG